MIFEEFAVAHSTVLWLAFAIAFVMGLVANKTNFCTMGAVSDLVNMGDTGRIRAWILAMMVATLGVIILESSGLMSVDSSLPPYRGSNFAWLEYILGGILFGIGMTYGSGCGNKTLVRIGGGNIKSVMVFLIISVCAYFMLFPLPGGTSETLYSYFFYGWTNKTSISMSTNQDLGSVVGGITDSNPVSMRLIIGLLLVALMAWFIFKSKDFRKSFDNILGGLVIGLAVLAAWYVSSSLVTINADGDSYSWTQYAGVDVWSMVEDVDAPKAVGVQSYTFINPIGQTFRYASQGLDSLYLTFGVMAVFGVILGSFAWSVLTRGFRIEWFVNIRDFVNHFIGAILMGIGGILAMGCTIGQAITGVSTLAMGSFLAFGGIVLGSAMTMKIQYYKMVYEDEATFVKAFITGLVDLKLLPESMRKLEAI